MMSLRLYKIVSLKGGVWWFKAAVLAVVIRHSQTNGLYNKKNACLNRLHLKWPS